MNIREININYQKNICAKLKNIYFKDKDWYECYHDVANKFDELKSKISKFYSEPNHFKFLKELDSYSEKDISDALDS